MQVPQFHLSSILRICFSCLWVILATAFVPTAIAASASEGDTSEHVLYVETNDQTPGNNAVLAYRVNPRDGSLSPLGTFPTRGTGGDDSADVLGPLDHDQEIVVSEDQKLLFAINGGSNTIAVFRIHGDGRLTHVEGSPFPSGGLTPVSLGLAGDKLYVVNGNNNGMVGAISNMPANYTGFHIRKDGRLEPIPGSTVEVPGDSNPTQANIASVGSFLFGVDLFSVPYPQQIVPFFPARGGLLHSFQIHEDGSLQEAPGGPFLPPADTRLVPTFTGSGYLLGLKAHPTERILYVGEVVTDQLAVYTYDDNGTLTLVHETPLGVGGTAICWLTFDKDHRHLFAVDAGVNGITVFDLANPRAPVVVQQFTMTIVGANASLFPPIFPESVAGVPFQISLDPSGKFLFVLSRSFTQNNNFQDGNNMHILQVQPDGTLVEPAFSPLLLPVPPTVKPTGNVVVEVRSAD
ncbi:MAG TPA: beta-propeller fold lactonase family protein [Candidatus Saccharimonadales bacterium]|jgi:6-phosphogluconolactonase (cycloisomerase 2 family)|nr:beta-propeller fold lactonase family protein [Candidatus Saccharimonadales bacterium]